MVYETFLTTATQYFDAAWEQRHDPYRPEPDEDAFIPLRRASEQLGIYGSREAAACARELTKMIMDYGYGSPSELTLESTLEERTKVERAASDAILAWTEFLREVVRKDFGVD